MELDYVHFLSAEVEVKSLQDIKAIYRQLFVLTALPRNREIRNTIVSSKSIVTFTMCFY